MNSIYDLVEAYDGCWPDFPKPGFYMGTTPAPDLEEYIVAVSNNFMVTKTQFEAEASRQGYVEGFEGHPDDVAFKGEWLPNPGDQCSVFHNGRWIGATAIGAFGEIRRCMVCAPNGGGFYGFYPKEIRPLKSDRERWIIEAQKHCVEYGSNNIGRIYDALISGELPTPEAK